MQTILLTSLAMLAFAANSVLGRLALLDSGINDGLDAGAFTLIRLVSGAFTLLLVIAFVYRRPILPKRLTSSHLLGSLALFGYAISFSYAYIQLATGTGALILFAVVQISMIAYYLVQGNRLSLFEWIGLSAALVGFLLLLLPSASRPDPLAAALMGLSGAAWALFTLVGKRAEDPAQSTLHGFLGASILALLVTPLLIDFKQINTTGVLYAIASGSITSALGYLLWYKLLPQLTVLKASIVQLSVPALALLGGLLIVHEPISSLLLGATALILGGIAMVFIAKSNQQENSRTR